MKIRSLMLAIIFQILLIIAMLAYALMPLYLGKEIKVRVNLYDPRDLFRGNYVSLSYDFSNLQQYKFDEKTGVEIDIYDRNFSKNDEIYAILKQDANATYAFDKFSFTKPKDALFLAGKFDGYLFVKYASTGSFLTYNNAPPVIAIPFSESILPGILIAIPSISLGMTASISSYKSCITYFDSVIFIDSSIGVFTLPLERITLFSSNTAYLMELPPISIPMIFIV